MKAAVFHKYGEPDVLHVEEISRPEIKDNEILVRVHASTVTSGDARVRGINVPLGFKFIMRLMFGFNGPRNPVPGGEFAGIVETIGRNVSEFQPGDRVFGASEQFGANAEYIAVAEASAVTKMPENLDFDEAAATPFGALTSLVYLRDMGRVKAGQKLLIYGASGALGTYGIQLARHFGVTVTAVSSGANADLVKSLGADDVIDYTRENFAASGERWDVIFETVGKARLQDLTAALKPDGRCLLAVATVPTYFKILWHFLTGKKRIVAGVAAFTKKDLIFLRNLLAAGEIKPVIDRHFALDAIVDAHRYVDTGRKRGAVVVTIVEEPRQIAERSTAIS